MSFVKKFLLASSALVLSTQAFAQRDTSLEDLLSRPSPTNAQGPAPAAAPSPLLPPRPAGAALPPGAPAPVAPMANPLNAPNNAPPSNPFAQQNNNPTLQMAPSQGPLPSIGSVPANNPPMAQPQNMPTIPGPTALPAGPGPGPGMIPAQAPVGPSAPAPTLNPTPLAPMAGPMATPGPMAGPGPMGGPNIQFQPPQTQTGSPVRAPAPNQSELETLNSLKVEIDRLKLEVERNRLRRDLQQANNPSGTAGPNQLAPGAANSPTPGGRNLVQPPTPPPLTQAQLAQMAKERVTAEERRLLPAVFEVIGANGNLRARIQPPQGNVSFVRPGDELPGGVLKVDRVTLAGVHLVSIADDTRTYFQPVGSGAAQNRPAAPGAPNPGAAAPQSSGPVPSVPGIMAVPATPMVPPPGIAPSISQ